MEESDKIDALQLKQALTNCRDSDSGHGKTSSSSSACSEELSEQQNESFVDAIDQINDSGDICGPSSQLTSGVNEDDDEEAELRVRLEETTVILRMALNNQFVKALDICSRRADRELYASLANATLCFLRAALTLEQNDLQAALSAINQSFEVSARRRRKSTAAALMMRFIYRPNYNTFTDDEIHAELVNAESLLLLALISFLSDQSIICLVRGAFRIRTCYQRYKECQFIMENRTSWQSEEARKHFESGVRMGHGIFNLLMSYLPRRVLRFLEYVGFSGNRTVGVDELEKSVALDDGLRSVFSSLVILTYHSYIENLFGLGIYDAVKVKQLNESLLGHYPNSAFFLLFRGRYHQMEGNLVQALDNFDRCIKAQDDWKQFHSICHWEMMWCYAVQMDWKQAAYYSDLLRKNSKWSAASYTYQYATFLYAQLVEEQRDGLLSPTDESYQVRQKEIVDIMKTVPELRIRYAGKTIPAEKFAITRSMRFCEQNNRLTLPALEFLYIWNIFVTLRNSPKQVEQLLVRLNSEIKHIEKAQHEQQQQQQQNQDVNENKREADDEVEQVCDTWTDDLCLVLLLKGMCLKHLDKLDESESCFMKVIENEPNIKVDTFLVPHTAMELALLNITLKKYDQARTWVKMARNNYTGYLLETMVHFRLHAATRVIRVEQQQQQNQQLDDIFESSTESQQAIDDLELSRKKLAQTGIAPFEASSAS